MATPNGTRTRVTKAPDPPSGAPLAEIGATGLRYSGGMIDEEWLKPLQGDKALKVYGEMEADPIVGAMLWAISSELRRVAWSVAPAGTDQQAEVSADLIASCFDDMSHTVEDTVSEALTMVPYGWALLETVLKVRRGMIPGRPGESSAYNDGRIGWRKWPIRAQESRDRWEFDEAGGIAGMWQRIDSGDKAGEPVFIPIGRSLLFRVAAHKGNPEGRSALRSAYLAWYPRRRLQEFEAIGAEKDLVGIPKIGVPGDWLTSSATSDQQAAVAAYRLIGEQARRDEQACLIWPRVLDPNGHELITFELMASPGQGTNLGPIIERYNVELLMTLMADIILIGHNSQGSYALAREKYRAFERSLETFLASISSVINRHAIPRLLQVNNMPLDSAPRFAFASVEDTDLDVTGKFLGAMSAAGIPLGGNEQLERHLHDLAGWPWVPPDERAGAAGDIPD